MKKQIQSGMTLIELTVVLLILVAMAGLVVPYMTGTSSKALCDATDLSMQNLKKIIMDRYYLDTLGHFPSDKKAVDDYSLRYLFIRDDGLDNNHDTIIDRVTNSGNDIDIVDAWQPFDPETAVGWRGPYVMNGAINFFPVDGGDGDIDGDGDNTNLTDELHASFGHTKDVVDEAVAKVHVAVAPNDQVVLDGWGRPIILQVPPTCPYSIKPDGCARLVSAGPIPGRNIQFNGIDATINNAAAADRGNDRVLFLQISDPHQGGNKPCNEY